MQRRHYETSNALPICAISRYDQIYWNTLVGVWEISCTTKCSNDFWVQKIVLTVCTSVYVKRCTISVKNTQMRIIKYRCGISLWKYFRKVRIKYWDADCSISVHEVYCTQCFNVCGDSSTKNCVFMEHLRFRARESLPTILVMIFKDGLLSRHCTCYLL